MTLAGRVAVVTDSTASLPSTAPAPPRVIVVPLRLLAGDMLADDGAPGVADAIEAVVARGDRLTTARPVPGQFAAAYRAAADDGAGAVLSVHLSALLSGTISSAELAAMSAPVPVFVLDSQTIGSGLGLVVLAAVAAAREGLGLDAVAEAAGRCADQTSSLVAVDRPDALLASGRATGLTGSMAAGSVAAGSVAAGGVAAGSARLVSRTVLELRSGRIGVVDRVRTWSAAAAALADSAAVMAAELAAGLSAGPIEVIVEHVAAEARALALAARLRASLPQAARVYVVAAGSAIRIHAGRPMLGVSVGPAPVVR